MDAGAEADGRGRARGDLDVVLVPTKVSGSAVRIEQSLAPVEIDEHLRSGATHDRETSPVATACGEAFPFTAPR